MDLIHEDHVAPPTTVGGKPASLRVGAIATINADGTVDLKATDSRAGWTGMTIPAWYLPTVGDLMFIADIQGDPQLAMVIAPVSGLMRPTALSGLRANRPAATSVVNGVTYYATDNGITYQSNGTAWTAIGWEALRVTALPVNPAPEDAQLINYVADATNGVIWSLQYRSASASAYKWESVGASPLINEVLTQETMPATYNSYVGLTTPGPSIALPLAGDYEVELNAHVGNAAPAGAGVNQVRMSYDVGATGAVDGDAAFHSGISVATNGPAFGVHRARVRTGLTAVTLTAKYKQNNDRAYWADREMRVTPIRVG